ncbi:SDR family NAD(P)-dependent oxidoreductase [Corticicoccus populi]|uniref:SDR family NAD(P)-dependent oxidoreductase n=1 Tax=Corticicoccus populi TaxID=1812821 RepID=A0ABW5WXT7_9STAP
MNFGYEGKVAVITGSSKGIGRQTAEEMLKLGAKVMLVARNEENLIQTRETLSEFGDVSYVVKDVSDADAGEVIVEAVIQAFGRLDIVVNNAGGAFAENFENVEAADWQGDLDLKVLSAIKMVKAALPYLKESKGSVLNLTAVAGKAPAANTSPTSVSRAAGLALTKTMSKDLGQHGIRVNAVCIGLIRSDQIEKRWKETAPEMSWEEFAVTGRDNIPLGRIGDTKEAANVITFLCSDLASYVTGTAVNIDGGSAAVL